MKRSVIIYLILAVILFFIALKIFNNRKKEKTKSVPATANSIPADVFVACDTTAVFHLEEVGTVRAYEEVEIVSEISRRLVTVHFIEGEMVGKGKLLFKLDDSDLKARLEKLLIQEDLARKNEKRTLSLLEAGGETQKEYDEQLNILQTLKADIACLQVDIERTEIRAPFRGRVGIREVSPGAMLSPEIILTNLVDISKVRIEFSVPERYAGDISTGQGVSFTISGLPGKYEARVEAVQSVINTKTRSLRVMSVAENKSLLFVPGMSANVFMEFTENHKSIFVPAVCLIPTNMGYQVFVLRDGHATLKGITTGTRTNVSVQVLDGISVGDTIVMTNLLRIRKGSPVSISKVY